MKGRLGVSFVIGVALLAGASPAVAQSERRSRPGCQDQEVASFAQLFTGTVQDFRRLPSRSTLGMLTIGSVATIGAHSADSSIQSTLAGSRPLHETLEAGRYIGGTPFQLGAAFATYGIGRAVHNRCAASLGADLVQAQLMAEALTIGLKQSVRRARPEGSGFSFPSGHTTVSFASATVIQQHFGWKAGIPAYAVATYVAASRVQMKRHYLSDVAFGAALGIIAGRTVTIGHGNRKMVLTPMATPGGGGAALTWLGK